jgi:signal transduction histidine kinase
MKQLLLKILDLGVAQETNSWEIKKIRVLNILCLSTIISQPTYILVFASKGLIHLSWNNLLLFFYVLLILILNYKGRIRLARILYINVTFILLMFSFLFGDIGAEYVQIIIIISSLFFYSFRVALIVSFVSFINFTLAKLMINFLTFPDLGIAKYLFNSMNLTFTIVYLFLFVYLYRIETENQHNIIENKTKELEQKTKELIDLNDAKDKFFSLIAHDLRNPIGSIYSLHRMIEEDFNEISEVEMKTYLKALKESSYQAYSLLDNLLKWSISQRGLIPFHPKKIQMLKLIEDIFQLLNESAKQKNIQLKSKITENVILDADLDLLSTVLRNLITNSLKFTKRGGFIEVDYSFDDKFSKNTIIVRDNGIGIPKETLDKLFKLNEKVSRVGTEGEVSTGLGLIMCKEFIEKHNGNVRIESEVGEGTEVIFTIG